MNDGVEDFTECRRVIITGATSAIGLAATIELARRARLPAKRHAVDGFDPALAAELWMANAKAVGVEP